MDHVVREKIRIGVARSWTPERREMMRRRWSEDAKFRANTLNAFDRSRKDPVVREKVSSGLKRSWASGRRDRLPKKGTKEYEDRVLKVSEGTKKAMIKEDIRKKMLRWGEQTLGHKKRRHGQNTSNPGKAPWRLRTSD